jgi:hypothetical protein
MKPFNRFVLRPLLAGVVLLASLSAHAQSTRTWISSSGSDSNNCSRSSPCATLAGAYVKTLTGGIINVVDAMSSTGLIINKSITIEGAAGSQSGVLASNSTGFIIDGAGINVVLRNLQISGDPPTLPGLNGVRIDKAATVTIDNCDISGFRGAAPNGNGVLIDPSASGTYRLLIINSRIHHNGTGNDGGGVRVRPTGSSTFAFTTIRNSDIFDNNGYGVLSRDRSFVTVLDSTITGNTRSGVHVLTTGPLAETIVSDSKLVDNGYVSPSAEASITANGAGSIISLTGNTIVQNENGLRRLNGGHLYSAGDNREAGNTANGTTDGAVTSL